MQSELQEALELVNTAYLPTKSFTIYEKAYQDFIEWRKTTKYADFGENTLLAYFSHAAGTYKASTLWSRYSMLKSTIINKHNINICTYSILLAFLKEANIGYSRRSSSVFKTQHIEQFLNDAPDEIYLLDKVALLFGLYGALRREELYKLELGNIQDTKASLIIKVKDMKTKKTKVFAITEHLRFYHKYIALRPRRCTHNKLFLNYYNGKCTNVPVGINKIGHVPCNIATFLELPDPKSYTGHSLRNSSDALQYKTGDNIVVNQHMDGVSSNIAELHVENTFGGKTHIQHNTPGVGNTSTYTSSANIKSEPKLTIQNCLNLQSSNILQEPSELVNTAHLPTKSSILYEKAYQDLIEWKKGTEYEDIDETTLLAYFSHAAGTYKASTLWSRYSMLKSTINNKHNINLCTYSKLLAFLKNASIGYSKRSSSVFEEEHIKQFLNNALDEIYLLDKVVLLFGLYGALRREELYKLQLEDIQDTKSSLIVKAKDMKTKKLKVFVITEHLRFYWKYAALRPRKCTHNKLFLNYHNGKCTKVPVGINKIGHIPCNIATFLKLPDPKSYTGHSLRNSSSAMQNKTRKRIGLVYQHIEKATLEAAEQPVENTFAGKIQVQQNTLHMGNTLPLTHTPSINIKSEPVENTVTDKTTINHTTVHPGNISTSADTLLSNTESELKLIIQSGSNLQTPNMVSVLEESSELVNTAYLSKKSITIYEKVYQDFIEWMESAKYTNFSETMLLEYFHQAAKIYKASTLWSRYSMLKSTINNKHNINICTYSKLLAFLKEASIGYSKRSSSVFEKQHIEQFLSNALDEIYLLDKVVLLFGLYGALRREELYKLELGDIQDTNSCLIIKAKDMKTKKPQVFVITEHLRFYRKYIALRPRKCTHNKLFLNYHNGKCTKVPVGINKIGHIPCNIATFLELPDPMSYTAHSFRNSSAAIQHKTGNSIVIVNQHSGRELLEVIEPPVETILPGNNTSTLADTLVTNIKSEPVENTIDGKFHTEDATVHVGNISTLTDTTLTTIKSLPKLTIQNCSNCTIIINNFHYHK